MDPSRDISKSQRCYTAISPGSIGNRASRCIRTEILRVASATEMQLHYSIVWKFNYSPRERNGWHHKPDRYEISIEKLISLPWNILYPGLFLSFIFGHIGRGTTGRLSSASIMVRIMRRNNSYCIYNCVCVCVCVDWIRLVAISGLEASL